MFNRRYATLAVAGLVFATGMAVAVATAGSAHAPAAPVTIVHVATVESGEPTAPAPTAAATAVPTARRAVTVHHTATAVRAVADPEVSTVTEPTNPAPVTVADDSPGLSAVGDAPPAQPAPSPRVEGAPCVSFLGKPGTLAADLRTCVQDPS